MSLQLPPAPRILVVMMSALGDAVHVLPVITALKRHDRGTHITWVLQPGPASLMRGHPDVDDIVLYDRGRGWRSWLDVRRALHARHFDLVLDLQVYFKASIVTALAPGRIKLGFDRARALDGNWLVTTHRIPPHEPQHVQDQYFEFLDHLGIDPRPVEWRLPISAAERAAQAAWVARLDRPYCAVVVGTSRPEKNWAPARYARLLERLHADYGLQPVLVGGPSPVERAQAEAVKRQVAVPVLDELGDDVRKVVWLLDGAALVVSPDTGPLHIANALGRPLVGLYGYTNPRRFAPYGRADAVVDGYARWPGEPYPPSTEYRADGMDRVSVAAVLEVVERELRG